MSSTASIDAKQTGSWAAPANVLPPLSFNGTPEVAARVMVVDDQPANIQIIGTTLGNMGHEIIPATNGATALKRAALRTPDLILLDLLMPDMDGCEVCRQFKNNPAWKDIPVIFLSAADDKGLIVRALDSGGVDFITKPFNQAELISRVRTQLALKAASDRLKQLAEDKDELLGILAHDMKNYLGGIKMSAELLHGQIERFTDQRQTQIIENILCTSALSLSFLKEFLANAAADRGLAIKSEAVNLVDFATSVTRRYQEAARRKKMTIETDFPAKPVAALADVTALDQVLDNLLSNALKFSPKEKNVFVTVRLLDKHAECEMRDEGPGFTAADKMWMYGRYKRLSARPTGGEPSTGLGLSIVHKLVVAMNGELSCESTPGNGATFTVRLPRPV